MSGARGCNKRWCTSKCHAADKKRACPDGSGQVCFASSAQRVPGVITCTRPMLSMPARRLPSDGSMPTELGEGEPIQFEEPAYELRWVPARLLPSAACRASCVWFQMLLHGVLGTCSARQAALRGRAPITAPGKAVNCLFNIPALLATQLRCSCGAQGDFDSPVLRMHYCSLRTPDQTIDYNMATGARWVPAHLPACLMGRGCAALDAWLHAPRALLHSIIS